MTKKLTFDQFKNKSERKKTTKIEKKFLKKHVIENINYSGIQKRKKKEDSVLI